MNTDIVLLVLIAIAVLVALVEVLREVLADRPSHQPRSHFEDPRFRSPGGWN